MPRVPVTDSRLVLTSSQLRRRGYSPDRIRAQVDAGRWRRWGYAIVMHNGPLTDSQRYEVARVHGGPRALFTAFTALHDVGLRGWEREPVDVLVPVGARRNQRCPVPLRLHRRRDWDGVRRSTATAHHRADAVLVAAGTFDSPRPACGLAAAVVQQRLLRPTDLREALDRAPRQLHRRALLAAVSDIAQGAEALSEIDFTRLCRRAGLPEPVHQQVRVEPGGRRRYLDATWRRRDGRLVVAEIDGALHLDQRRWWDDQLRQNEISLGDALVLRFPSAVVRLQPEVVITQLRRALHC